MSTVFNDAAIEETLHYCPYFCSYYCSNLRSYTTFSSLASTGLPMEASAWTDINVVNLKNNKILDIGNLPAAWLELSRLYLGIYVFMR